MFWVSTIGLLIYITHVRVALLYKAGQKKNTVDAGGRGHAAVRRERMNNV